MTGRTQKERARAAGSFGLQEGKPSRGELYPCFTPQSYGISSVSYGRRYSSGWS